MEKLIKWLSGRKTYFVAIAVVVLGLLQGLDIFTLPDAAWPIIGAVGLGFMRASISKISDEIKKPKRKK